MPGLRCSSGLLVAAAIAVGATGPASGQSKPNCIDLATSIHNVSTGPGGGGTSDYTCSFDKNTLNHTCQIRSKSSVGVQDQTTVATYASLDDLIKQVAVIPPLTLATKMLVSGMGVAWTTTYAYDASKRQVREVTDGGSYTDTLIYSAWDASGRPTKSRSTSTRAGLAPTDDVIAYDDAARTVTHTRTGGVIDSTMVIEFNAQGLHTRTTVQNRAGKTVATMNILATEKICR